MDPRQQESILATLEAMRKQTDALFIVGIRDGDFFYSVDDMVTPETVEQELRGSAPHIAASIHRKRAGGQR